MRAAAAVEVSAPISASNPGSAGAADCGAAEPKNAERSIAASITPSCPGCGATIGSGAEAGCAVVAGAPMEAAGTRVANGSPEASPAAKACRDWGERHIGRHRSNDLTGGASGRSARGVIRFRSTPVACRGGGRAAHGGIGVAHCTLASRCSAVEPRHSSAPSPRISHTHAAPCRAGGTGCTSPWSEAPKPVAACHCCLAAAAARK